MKLSIEAKVAAAVASAFVILTAAAIGQKGVEAQSVGPNNYPPIENPGQRVQATEGRSVVTKPLLKHL